MMLLLLQAATDSVMPVSTELPALITTSALSVAVIQAIKNSNLPIFKAFGPDSVGLNRTLAWLAALIAGVGIHWHYDTSLGSLTVTGLTGPALYSAGVNAAKSYAFNWLIYRGAIRNPQKVAEAAAVPAVPQAQAQAPAEAPKG